MSDVTDFLQKYQPKQFYKIFIFPLRKFSHHKLRESDLNLRKDSDLFYYKVSQILILLTTTKIISVSIKITINLSIITTKKIKNPNLMKIFSTEIDAP